MTEYDNNNRGVLFKNEDRKSDKHPNYTGSATINNQEMYLSAWINESKSGKSYLKISFSDKTEKKETQANDIPF